MGDNKSSGVKERQKRSATTSGEKKAKSSNLVRKEKYKENETITTTGPDGSITVSQKSREGEIEDKVKTQEDNETKKESMKETSAKKSFQRIKDALNPLRYIIGIILILSFVWFVIVAPIVINAPADAHVTRAFIGLVNVIVGSLFVKSKK